MEGRAVSMAEHQCHAHTGEWLYAEVRKQLAFCGLESQLWVPGRTRMHERPHLNFCRFVLIHFFGAVSMQMNGESKRSKFSRAFQQNFFSLLQALRIPEESWQVEVLCLGFLLQFLLGFALSALQLGPAVLKPGQLCAEIAWYRTDT
eukprot:62450-Pelagomonas_calceolata.AAC.3